jgi:putative transposase
MTNVYHNGKVTMANEQDIQAGNPVGDASSEVAVPAPKKRKLKSGPTKERPKEAVSAPEPAKPRRYSASEKTEKLGQIDAKVGAGATLRTAIKETGISEQTYYQWKRSAVPSDQPQAKPPVASDSLSDLVELEAENQRLRKLLAEKLRAENAELRKRLGLK